MPTFIDESGDTGPEKSGGSTYFRLAAVWVPDITEATLFREEIRQLRSELALPQTFEFKYAKTHRNPELRRAFFDEAMTLDFRFAVSTINKQDVYWARADRREIHWACATELAAALRATYQRANLGERASSKDFIVVDDNGDKALLATIKRQFRGLRSRHSSRSSMIDKVVFRSSGPTRCCGLSTWFVVRSAA